jgi:hypothetical protein
MGVQQDANFKNVYGSVSREVLHNILIQFAIPLKLVRLIKMCLDEMYKKVYMGKYVSEALSIQSRLKQRDASSSLFFSFSSEHTIRKVGGGRTGIEWDTSVSV